MSSVNNDTTNSNPVSDKNIGDASTDVASDVIEATEAEAKKIADYRASEAKLVDLAVATLDPKDMLKKYARMGKETLGLAKQRMDSLAAGAWNGKEDFAKVCSDLETLVRMRVPIKQIDMNVYARVHLWVEAVKALVPNVEKLSYFQVTSKFVHTLRFDPADLSGEIKKDWLTWVRTTVERQLSDDPMTMKELDASIEAHKKEIERERQAKSRRTPEQVLEAEQRAANRKQIAERTAAQTKVSNAVADALSEGKADVNDIVKIVKDVVAQSKLDMPSRLVGFYPENCTIADCKLLASAMCNAGKYDEMKYLRNRLDAMIKIAENAMVASDVA